MGVPAALYGFALLCALGLAQSPAEGPRCGRGHFQHGTGTNVRCCRQCVPGQQPCPEGDCVCVQPEYHCEDPQCKACKHHPCPPGQEVHHQGKFLLGFKCVDCAMGTFSTGHEGRCKPWADCTKLGFLTIFPGNKTHNAVCIPEPLPTEQHGQLTIILFAMAAYVLLLITAQLILHIWQLRRQQMWLRETQPLLEVPLSPAEDSCSCQFPEEERGERMEKSQLGP
uniref:TNFR-Cys domain-containing protein n=1 Tax=Jaculus jaculus TaxID=51337 RepID=A0A8C5L6K5_JACJA|nr:tumor necrosis factor receptor superfamily member 18 isoform X2 [Jaculus jaculus]